MITFTFSPMNKNGSISFITNVKAFVIVLLIVFLQIACGGTKKNYDCEKPPFPIPPDVTTVEGEDPYAEIRPQPVADVYWDNTKSQFGYVQNRVGKIEPSKEFSRFFAAVTRHAIGGNYRPQYWILRPSNGDVLRWGNVPVLDPKDPQFYTFKGHIDSTNGPLTMIYKGNLINPKNLTIVLSDLEEQYMNLTLLADLIRDKILKTDDYSAAVIATRLSFNGDNWRPNERFDGMTPPIKYNGEKPLYAIVSGPRDAVKHFLSNFRDFAKDYNIEYNVATTLQKGEQKLLDIFKDVEIPNRATRNEVNLQSKKQGIIPPLASPTRLNAYEASRAKERIWNLEERTDITVDYLRLLVGGEYKKIKEPLGLRIFEYKKTSPSWKNNNWLWALNIAFELPKGVKTEDLECKIKNYRYLTNVQKKIEIESYKDEENVSRELDGDEYKDLQENDSQELDGDDSKRLQENDSKQFEELTLLQWEKNDEFIRKGLDVHKFDVGDANKCVFCIYPKHKYGELESSVVCFDIIVKMKQKIGIPKWVDSFNDNDYENPEANQDRTFNFKKFVTALLKDEVIENVEYVNNELVRLPVMLFNMPFENAK